MKKLLFVLITAGCTLWLSGCYYDKYNELYPTQANTCDTTNVTYGKQISQITSNYCISCHSSTLQSGGYNFDNYSDVKAHTQDSLIIYAVQGSHGLEKMPQGSSLSDCNIKIIEKWAAEGCPQ